jgi:hypothetical protein
LDVEFADPSKELKFRASSDVAEAAVPVPILKEDGTRAVTGGERGGGDVVATPAV